MCRTTLTTMLGENGYSTYHTSDNEQRIGRHNSEHWLVSRSPKIGSRKVRPLRKSSSRAPFIQFCAAVVVSVFVLTRSRHSYKTRTYWRLRST